MLREFEIFSKSSSPTVAVKRGFSWPGFLFTWVWALSRRLWVHGAVLVGIGILISVPDLVFRAANPLLFGFPGLIVMAVVGVRGNSWRSKKLERDGYEFVGLVEARSPAAAVAAYSLGKRQESAKARPGFSFIPRSAQGLLAVTSLTWKAALRYRLFFVIAVLLLVAVIGLPMLIKDDGTARGFTQIVLTYTLGSATTLLGLCTLWLSCGTLARDIEECQMQVVVTKPIARWQIWLGKWLGIVTLNAALLALSGACVFGLMQWRSKTLPPKEQEVLRSEVLVARGSAKPDDVQEKIKADARKILEERLKKTPLSSPQEVQEVQNQILEQVKAEYQLVPSGFAKPWEIHFGAKAKSLRDQPLQVRIKFNTADRTTSGTYTGVWGAGVPQKTKLWRSEPMSLAPDTFHEFQIPAGLIDENGVLTITFANFNSTALLFPLEDGMEVLYRDGGFGLNFVRGLAIILFWMALLAAIGLASASFLSFPVAALLSLTILTMTLASGTMASVVSEGTIDSNSSATGSVVVWALNHVIVPVFSVAVKIINFATNCSPIDSLSTGRSISWVDLGLAFAQVVLVLGGIFALCGIFLFSRRELATAQAQ